MSWDDTIPRRAGWWAWSEDDLAREFGLRDDERIWIPEHGACIGIVSGDQRAMIVLSHDPRWDRMIETKLLDYIRRLLADVREGRST